MKRSATVIFTILSMLSATIHADEYTWDISIAPVGAHEYEFRANLKQCVIQTNQADVAEMTQENILSVPPLKVTSDKPADFELRKPGEGPKIKAKVVMQETPKKVIFTYSAMVMDGTIRHTTQGQIEINR